MTEGEDAPPGVDATQPTRARLYDYLLGGTNNFPVDRDAAEKLLAIAPDMTDAILANRGFRGRAAVWMARQGIRQFIDLGAGLPTKNNTHDAVQKVAPTARVVYVDDDQLLDARADRMLASNGTTSVVIADPRHPDAVLSHRDLRRIIDFDEPVGVLMTTVLHFVPDEDDPAGIVWRYMTAVAPGSYLALAQGTADNIPPRALQAGVEMFSHGSDRVYLRPRAEVERLFDGLELVSPYGDADPGLTYVGLWGADDVEAADSEGSRGMYCGVARRPEGYGSA
jgi:hypothetical protein